jgi:BAAT / Acyl-CoA thioester hydrolase C terminal/Acyl-CoA thioester hydrolase/BAAT N-terminal region
VTISTRSVQPFGIFAARATYRANAAGVLDLARTAPRSGTYSDVDPMGLFWSARVINGRPLPVRSAVTTLTVSAEKHRLASTTVTQLLLGTGVTERTETVTSAGFYGEYFAPPGGGRRPAVVKWGGSEGGILAQEAELLASHGIPTLALAYFDAPGLPCSLSDIPLEYFVKAIRWLKRQPQVDPRRLWLYSGSRGTEAELLVASNWPGLIHGVVAEAPGAYSYGAFPGTCRTLPSSAAWTLQDKPLPQAGFAGGSYISTPEGPAYAPLAGFQNGLLSPDTAAARIPVSRFHGPVLLVSGGDDQLWPSNLYAGQIMARLRGDPAPHEHLNYPEAGHVVLSFPYGPPLIVAHLPEHMVAFGGTAAADNAAWVHDWPAMIAFIKAR